MKENNKRMVFSVIVVLLFLLAFPFIIPSGAMLVEAKRWYVDHTPDALKTTPLVEEKILADGRGAGGSMDQAGRETLGEIKALPVDFSPGLPLKEENFTGESYQDSTISVQMKTEEIDEAVYHVAHIKIAHASQLRTALAAPFGVEKTNKPSTMAINNNAVVAINGDYYSQRDGGYIIRQGETYRKSMQKSLDNLLIDENGDFHIVKGGDEAAMEKVLAGDVEIVNAFTFGPALIIDGQVQETPEEYLFNVHGKDPRAAIGQVGPLEYVIVAVDGRSEASTGVTTATLADYMKQLGCVQAFNLDGGNSATLIFHNDYYNVKSKNAERSISDIIYFASAE